METLIVYACGMVVGGLLVYIAVDTAYDREWNREHGVEDDD